MKICKKCGYENLSEDKFCVNCGNTLNTVESKTEKPHHILMLLGALCYFICGILQLINGFTAASEYGVNIGIIANIITAIVYICLSYIFLKNFHKKIYSNVFIALMSVMCIIELLPLFGIGYSGFQMLNIVKYIVLISIIISGTKNKNSNIFLCLIFAAMLFSVKTIVSYVSSYIHGYIDIGYFTRTAWSFFNALGELFFELWCLTLSPKVRRIFTKKMNFAYSNNSEKKAVATSSYKTIDECLQIDSVSKELWYWAEWFEKWGKAVFVLMIIGGLISSVIISNMDDDFSLSVFIINLSKNALYAFIEYVAYHTLSVLTGAVATITQNTRVTAKLAEYRTRKEENKVTVNSNKQQRSETNDMPKL